MKKNNRIHVKGEIKSAWGRCLYVQHFHLICAAHIQKAKRQERKELKTCREYRDKDWIETYCILVVKDPFQRDWIPAIENMPSVYYTYVVIYVRPAHWRFSRRPRSLLSPFCSVRAPFKREEREEENQISDPTAEVRLWCETEIESTRSWPFSSSGPPSGSLGFLFFFSFWSFFVM